jgi:hypothetical protein
MELLEEASIGTFTHVIEYDQERAYITCPFEPCYICKVISEVDTYTIADYYRSHFNPEGKIYGEVHLLPDGYVFNVTDKTLP